MEQGSTWMSSVEHSSTLRSSACRERRGRQEGASACQTGEALQELVPRRPSPVRRPAGCGFRGCQDGAWGRGLGLLPQTRCGTTPSTRAGWSSRRNFPRASSSCEQLSRCLRVQGLQPLPCVSSPQNARPSARPRPACVSGPSDPFSWDFGRVRFCADGAVGRPLALRTLRTLVNASHW